MGWEWTKGTTPSVLFAWSCDCQQHPHRGDNPLAVCATHCWRATRWCAKVVHHRTSDGMWPHRDKATVDGMESGRAFDLP